MLMKNYAINVGQGGCLN